jgi:hypothetical protein
MASPTFFDGLFAGRLQMLLDHPDQLDAVLRRAGSTTDTYTAMGTLIDRVVRVMTQIYVCHSDDGCSWLQHLSSYTRPSVAARTLAVRRHTNRTKEMMHRTSKSRNQRRSNRQVQPICDAQTALPDSTRIETRDRRGRWGGLGPFVGNVLGRRVR